MNRSGKFKVIKIGGDPKYNCQIVHKTINKVMIHGHKQRAAKIVYEVLERLESHYSGNEENGDGAKILATALSKIKPQVLLRPKKIASRIYRVPVAITPEIAIKKAIMWLVHGSRVRKSEKTFTEKMFFEIKEVIDEEKGESIKKKLNYHRIAKDNEAFVHYI